MSPPPDPGFGLYVHWPFCLAKCPYCDFNSHVRPSVDHRRWTAALLRELERWAWLTPGRVLTSLFFGGGTPSLMAPETVAAVIAAAGRAWTAHERLEITLEANPTSVEAGRLAAFRQAGVNRVSLGVQALDDAALAFLGRAHGAAEALAALQLAQRLFPRVSFDLIYARPGQTVAQWREELARALGEGTGHLSAYQLTIEPGTPFHTRHARGEIALPDEDTQVALMDATERLAGDHGLRSYEVSNLARPGEECRHNLTYWRMGDFIGIGPGAHGRVTLDGRLLATRTHRAPEIWLERVERAGEGGHPPEPVAPEAQVEELLMMGLRLTEGVPEARLTAAAGAPLGEILPLDRLTRLVEEGLLERRDGRLAASPTGRRRLNAVLAWLLA